jgi:hypothetical protein
LVSVGVRLAAFNLPSIAKLTMTDELHLQELGERKIALFCCIPDSDKSLNYLVGMIYTQLIQTLYRQADRVHKGRLPVPVHCLMDEYANISLPKDTFLSALATMRSRAIFCSIIVQNMAQLKAIHGRKQIVWRCVNRLEYGTKFCSNSPSIPETELHQAILKAVQNLAAKFTGEVADQLNGILHQIEVGESLTPQLQAQLEQNQQEFDHLLEMSLDFDENTPFLDDKLKRLSDKIKQLKTAITQSSVNSQTPSTPTNPITAKDLLITEYDDMLTARIIEKIIVKSRQDLEIIFIGGYTQQISLQ